MRQTNMQNKNWKRNDHSDEVRISINGFLAIKMKHMGQVKLPTMEHYWSSSSIYKFTFFSNIMSRNRFQLLLRFSHFSDNESIEKGQLSKVKLFLDHLNDTMRQIYVPGKDLSLDELMMLWRGRLIFRQYIKNKKT